MEKRKKGRNCCYMIRSYLLYLLDETMTLYLQTWKSLDKPLSIRAKILAQKKGHPKQAFIFCSSKEAQSTSNILGDVCLGLLVLNFFMSH